MGGAARRARECLHRRHESLARACNTGVRFFLRAGSVVVGQLSRRRGRVPGLAHLARRPPVAAGAPTGPGVAAVRVRRSTRGDADLWQSRSCVLPRADPVPIPAVSVRDRGRAAIWTAGRVHSDAHRGVARGRLHRAGRWPVHHAQHSQHGRRPHALHRRARHRRAVVEPSRGATHEGGRRTAGSARPLAGRDRQLAAREHHARQRQRQGLPRSRVQRRDAARDRAHRNQEGRNAGDRQSCRRALARWPRARHRDVVDRRGPHRDAAARGPVPSGTEDGGRRPAGGRHRTRFQQPAHRDHRNHRAAAGGCGYRFPDAPRRSGDREGGHADPGQLQQAIVNLVVNARDAMPMGGRVTIETADVELDPRQLETHSLTRAGPHVMIAVHDNGVGMDAATKARLFEPFFTTKEPGRGTGLGLATVYSIVKQSGGYSWAYSELGHGTTFKIYLPRVAGRPEPAGGGASSDTPAPLAVGSETVLVVEDQLEVRNLTTRILEARGYTVLAADGGAEALEVAGKYLKRIDLLLTDVVMPEMNGRQLALRLSEQRRDMKVLFVSGYTGEAIRQHGLLEQR